MWCISMFDVDPQLEQGYSKELWVDTFQSLTENGSQKTFFPRNLIGVLLKSGHLKSNLLIFPVLSLVHVLISGPNLLRNRLQLISSLRQIVFLKLSLRIQ